MVAELSEQAAYYRAAATTYDRAYQVVDTPLTHASRVLDLIRGDVLEIACGTGQWTALIVPRVASLVALDASQEAIEIAQARCAGGGVDISWVHADLFEWSSDDVRFDTIFFAFWLSHVPRDLWHVFWGSLREMLAPGGSVVVIDEAGPEMEREEHWVQDRDESVYRVANGELFQVVKLRLQRAAVLDELSRLGWNARWISLGTRFLALTASPASSGPPHPLRIGT